MKKLVVSILLVLFVLAMISSAAFAAPVEKTAAFVCPVINNLAVGMHNPQAVEIAGGYTIGRTGGLTSHIMVPVHATNGDGAGSPGGWHAAPGDMDYTAVWASLPG